MYSQQFVPNTLYGHSNSVPYPPGMYPTQMAPSIPAGAPLANYGPPPPPASYDGGMHAAAVPPPMSVAGPQVPPALPLQQPPLQAYPPYAQPPPMLHRPTTTGAPPSRNNEIGEPSRVIHLRNVTPEVTQLSIQNLVQNFGGIKHIVMLRQMNQALVEMETLKSAEQIVQFFQGLGYAEVDGRRVYIRYSNHPELSATQHTTRSLLVSMFNTQYDVSAATQITPEIVYQIFASYGPVQRIVVLPKNESSQHNHNRVQALVQFNTRENAEHVKNILQGQPVTIGEMVTFTLDIQFSRLDEIKTTNPMTSLIVDANGATHRPQTSPSPSDAPAAPAQPSDGNCYAQAPSQWC